MKQKTRSTRQKEFLKEEIEKMNAFFSAEDLFKKVKEKELNLGIATVYRFLSESVKKGELHSYLCDRRTLYSVRKSSHCHFICEKTGKVIHFELDNVDFLKKIKNKIPGEIHSFQLEIKGVCDNCNGK